MAPLATTGAWFRGTVIVVGIADLIPRAQRDLPRALVVVYTPPVLGESILDYRDEYTVTVAAPSASGGTHVYTGQERALSLPGETTTETLRVALTVLTLWRPGYLITQFRMARCAAVEWSRVIPLVPYLFCATYPPEVSPETLAGVPPIVWRIVIDTTDHIDQGIRGAVYVRFRPLRMTSNVTKALVVRAKASLECTGVRAMFEALHTMSIPGDDLTTADMAALFEAHGTVALCSDYCSDGLDENISTSCTWCVWLIEHGLHWKICGGRGEGACSCRFACGDMCIEGHDKACPWNVCGRV